MIAASMKVATLTGAVLLLMDQGALALWGMVVTTVAGLVAQYLKDRAAAAADERRFSHEEAERKAASNARAEIASSLAENTALTREGIDAANHVNEKFATLAEAAKKNAGK